jgi:hypothetical protein
MPRAKTVKPLENVLRADGRTGRYYIIPSETPDGTPDRVPSVTNVLGVINKPALIPWAAKEERTAVIEAAADFYEALQALPTPLPRAGFVVTLLGRLTARKAHQKTLDAACEIGSQTHARIEWELKRGLGLVVGPEPALVPEARLAFDAWRVWADAVQLTPKHIEQVVYSRTHRYAGTLDLVATFRGPRLLAVLQAQGPVAPDLARWLWSADTVTAVIDFKTGKAIYRESHLQSVAYQRALAEMGHGRVDGGLIVRLPKVATDPGFEVVVVPPARDLFPVFLATRLLWDWQEVGEAEYRARQKAPAAPDVLTPVEVAS